MSILLIFLMLVGGYYALAMLIQRDKLSASFAWAACVAALLGLLPSLLPREVVQELSTQSTAAGLISSGISLCLLCISGMSYTVGR